MADLCHRDLDDDGLSCHLPEGHEGACDGYPELGRYGGDEAVNRAVSLLVNAARVSPVLREAMATVEDELSRLRRKVADLAESEASAWSYAHSAAASSAQWGDIGDV